MPAIAGYNIVLQTSPDDSTYTDIAGIKNFSAPQVADSLDTTAFNATQWREKIQGLKNCDGSMDGDWIYNDTAQNTLATAYGDGSTAYIKVLFDGTHGFKVPVKVMSYERSPAIDGIVPVTFAFESTGAPTTI